MITRKYRYLIALAREKHFGHAAAACHVSPSTLSAAIRDIEETLGVSVVERGQQFTGLTPEGVIVVDYAQRVAASVDDLRQELASLRDELTGRLRLGAIPTAMTAIAGLTSAFCRRHPGVTVEVLSLNNSEIVERLQRFELDAGLVYLHSVDDNAALKSVPLWCERHVLLTAQEGAFSGYETVSWRDAANTPLCLLTPDMMNRQTIDAVFQQVGADATPTLETNSILCLLAHVGSGYWSSIIPRSVLEQIGTPPNVVAIELVEPNVDWATALVTLAREPAPPMVREILSQAERLAASFGGDE
ncbi:MAG: LysR family transcriptional regulator [Candidatus Thiodiazotropha sp.]|jgi:DNA-binding transcriptional LysR family regulator